MELAGRMWAAVLALSQSGLVCIGLAAIIAACAWLAASQTPRRRR